MVKGVETGNASRASEGAPWIEFFFARLFMRRVDSTPHSWEESRVEGQNESRWVNRVVTKVSTRSLSVYFFCPSSPFSHVISSDNWPCNGRNPSTRSFKRVSSLDSREILGPRDPCEVLFEFFLFYLELEISLSRWYRYSAIGISDIQHQVNDRGGFTTRTLL